MPSNQKHIINKLQVDVETRNPKAAFDLKDNIDAFLKHEIFPYLENYFSTIEEDLHSRVIQIPYLSVDVDTSSALNYNELKEDVKRALIKEVKKVTQSAHPQNEEAKLITIDQNREKMFLQFLETGRNSWFASSEEIFEPSKQEFSEMLRSKSFLMNLKAKLMKTSFRNRMIHQLSDHQLTQVLEAISSGQFDQFRNEKPFTLLSKVKHEEREMIWDCIIDQTLYPDTEVFSSRLIFMMTQKISGRKNKKQEPLQKSDQLFVQLIIQFLGNLENTPKAFKSVQLIRESGLLNNLVFINKETNNADSNNQEETNAIEADYDTIDPKIERKDVPSLNSTAQESKERESPIITSENVESKAESNLETISTDRYQKDKFQSSDSQIKTDEEEEAEYKIDTRASSENIDTEIGKLSSSRKDKTQTSQSDASEIGEIERDIKEPRTDASEKEVGHGKESFVENSKEQSEAKEHSQTNQKEKKNKQKDYFDKENSTVSAKENKQRESTKPQTQVKDAEKTIEQNDVLGLTELEDSLDQLIELQDSSLFRDLRDQQKEYPSNQSIKGELQINNAGLILLHPYLKDFLKNCELLDDENKIVNEDLAVHLLHYLATKKEHQYESNMLFEKILCGVSIEKPIARNIALSDELKSNAEDLLEAVLTNWGVLKNASPDLLRYEFLQRFGKISFKEVNPKITVERKVHDILLDKLPWNIGICRLPWLEFLLFTDW